MVIVSFSSQFLFSLSLSFLWFGSLCPSMASKQYMVTSNAIEFILKFKFNEYSRHVFYSIFFDFVFNSIHGITPLNHQNKQFFFSCMHLRMPADVKLQKFHSHWDIIKYLKFLIVFFYHIVGAVNLCELILLINWHVKKAYVNWVVSKECIQM